MFFVKSVKIGNIIKSAFHGDFRNIFICFPKKLTPEFLLVDAINNLDELAEDKNQVLQMVERKLSEFDHAKLTRAISDYGSVATKKRFMRWLDVSR